MVQNTSYHDIVNGGWPVTDGSEDLLPISNPGASDVDIGVWILGTK